MTICIAAKLLVEEKQVKLIAGMQTWQEATLVSDVGKQAQVPVLSFAAAAITPPLTQFRWPSLLQMATDSSAEMNCIAAIVKSFNWRRIIAIYENDVSGGESGMLALLSEALQSVGSEIEHLVLLPPSSSLSDPKEFVHDAIAELLKYMQEDNLEVGIHALRAYDSITAISRTIKALGSDSTDLSKSLLEGISSSNFRGLSGDILFLDGKLSEPTIYRIVNIGGKRYRELEFWSSKFGFSGNLNSEQSGKNRLSPSLIIWPGDLQARVPKGWAMPTVMNKMRIGVPNGSFFYVFVEVESTDSSKKPFDGFCIEVFEEVVKMSERNYSFPYKFNPFSGTYGELIDEVVMTNL
ncbi:hypothetical protein RJ639_010028 [Escallonia herrerae]|uniref:Receptor ligand binding region domain-containing protein n=1 Tax=Escallonia herrerae TaxID=1293975 RepID=A0AA89AT89_9ASTE|nr:hypothetical protein RJ639_010028 [Escallonia herrerae]